MIINGHLTLCKAQLINTTTDMPQLLVHAVDDGLGIDGVAYKLVWTGRMAKAFWSREEHRLKLGAPLNVIAINPQPLKDADGHIYMLASALDIQVLTPAAKTPSPKWSTGHETATV